VWLRLIALSLVLGAGHGLPALPVPPRPAEAVLDRAGFLSASERASLSGLCERIWRATSFAPAILTVESLEGDSINAFAVQAYKAWGIGAKGKDEGALIVLAKEERLWRIEVGYGAESYLPDLIVNRIGQERLVPLLAQGQVAEGLRQSLLAFAERVAAERKIAWDEKAGPLPAPRKKSGVPGWVWILCVVGVLALLPFPLGRQILWTILMIALSRGRSGGGGFGGGGGGFGGFGGGMSGGGGAGGRW